jgi:hypothetical protein
MQYLHIVFFGVLAGVSCGVTWLSYVRSKQGKFYSDTPWLLPMGIFVWGDGLVIGPFWAVSSGVLMWLSWLDVVRYCLVFYSVRSAYEVVYWLNHQAVGKTYRPPLFRHIAWLGSEEAAILYQLMNMCQVIGGIGLLLLTFR